MALIPSLESEQIRMRDGATRRLALTARDVMTSNPVYCTPQDTVADAARLMVSYECAAIPVIGSFQDRRLLGIVTERDLVARVMARGLDPGATPVSAVMSERPVTVRPETPAPECNRLMMLHRVSRLPVLDPYGNIIGVVTREHVDPRISRLAASRADRRERIPDAEPRRVRPG